MIWPGLYLILHAISHVASLCRCPEIPKEWKLDGHGERLTNLRFADDMLLLAKNKDELREMMEWLLDDLASVGLDINKKKTKLSTTTSSYFKEGTSATIPINNKYFH